MHFENKSKLGGSRVLSRLQSFSNQWLNILLVLAGTGIVLLVLYDNHDLKSEIHAIRQSGGHIASIEQTEEIIMQKLEEKERLIKKLNSELIDVKLKVLETSLMKSFKESTQQETEQLVARKLEEKESAIFKKLNDEVIDVKLKELENRLVQSLKDSSRKEAEQIVDEKLRDKENAIVKKVSEEVIDVRLRDMEANLIQRLKSELQKETELKLAGLIKEAVKNEKNEKSVKVIEKSETVNEAVGAKQA
jgi:hypothetical protein